MYSHVKGQQNHKPPHSVNYLTYDFYHHSFQYLDLIYVKHVCVSGILFWIYRRGLNCFAPFKVCIAQYHCHNF